MRRRDAACRTSSAPGCLVGRRDLRQSFHRAKRALKHARRIDTILKVYVESVFASSLHAAIDRTKTWDELILSLDKNPWGPLQDYANKIETLGVTVYGVTGSLIPRLHSKNLLPRFWGRDVLLGEADTAPQEGERARRKEWESSNWSEKGSGKSLLAPAEYLARPGRSMAIRSMGNPLRRLYTDCLKWGIFSSTWKRAKLILFPKEDKSIDSLRTIGRYVCWTTRISFSRA